MTDPLWATICIFTGLLKKISKDLNGIFVKGLWYPISNPKLDIVIVSAFFNLIFLEILRCRKIATPFSNGIIVFSSSKHDELLEFIVEVLEVIIFFWGKTLE